MTFQKVSSFYTGKMNLTSVTTVMYGAIKCRNNENCKKYDSDDVNRGRETLMLISDDKQTHLCEYRN